VRFSILFFPFSPTSSTDLSHLGSAPDISGKGVVNPVGTILSVAMMLRYSLNLPKEAAAVEAAVKTAIDAGTRTRDIGGTAGTTEMGDAVVAELVKLLRA
jgi:3-isopropylmalate dehydrogenase